jgi:cell division protein FtsB
VPAGFEEKEDFDNIVGGDEMSKQDSIYGSVRRRSIVFPVISSIIIASLLAGGGVYLWQLGSARAERSSLQNQITTLQNEVKTLKAQPPAKTGNNEEAKLKDDFDKLKVENEKLKAEFNALKNETEAGAKEVIEARTKEAITAIKNKDFNKLSQMAYPELGIRFSPYAYVDMETSIVLTPGDIKALPKNKKVYTWGSYDGTGDPIRLTFDAYYKKFIYDKDFANAKEIGYNRMIGRGNSINNLSVVYPGAIFVEYHFPGEDPKYAGMDWKSLRLVFQEINNQWALVAIVHDEWTI